MHRLHSKYRKTKPRTTVTSATRARAAVTRRWELAKSSEASEPAAPATPAAAASASAAGPSAPQLATHDQESQESGRSTRKLDMFAKEPELQESQVPDNPHPNFLLVHRDVWKALISQAVCKECKEGELAVKFAENHGFVKKIILHCTHCDETISQTYTSIRVTDITSSKRAPFMCNRKLVDAFLDTGTRFSGIQRFAAAMGMETLSLKAYMDHFKKIMEENDRVREDIFTLAREKVREAHEALNPDLKKEKILDIPVSFDGSWAVTGFNSHTGFAGVIDILTGLVVDAVVFSRNCQMCAIKAIEFDTDSVEYKEWYKQHKESGECDKNFDGSAQSMEMIGAEVLWKRSVEVNQMRYTIVLSDGDSKTVTHLNNVVKPYGPDVIIEKEECTNHLSKRVGTALRNIVTEEKARKVTLGGRKEGALTADTINHLQKHYHGAIKKNLPDVAATQQAIKATIYHYSSTDTTPRHQFCPPGKDSWCFYNKDRALRKKKKDKHDVMSHHLNDLVFQKIKPIYERLSSEELLGRCARMGTQNANESLLSVIWRRCRKGSTLSRKRYEVGITRAVGEFNMGLQRMLEVRSQLSPEDEPNMVIAERIDRKRKLQSNKQDERTK